MNLKSLVLLSTVMFSGFFVYGETARAEEVCVITTAGDTVCGRPVKKKAAAAKRQEFKIENYVFTMKECARWYTGVYCEISITNNGAARNIRIVAKSQRSPAIIGMTDSLGTKYAEKGTYVQIGGTKGGDIDVELKPGKSYDLTLGFDNVTHIITKADELFLPIYVEDKPGLVRFTDVAIKPKSGERE
jgi:hypothetical protein